MNSKVRTQYTLIPGSTYRIQYEGEEKDLVFDGRLNSLGVGMLQWHDDSTGRPFLNRIDDQAFVVIQSLA